MRRQFRAASRRDTSGRSAAFFWGLVGPLFAASVLTGCAGRGTVATAPIDPEAPAISFDRPANDTTVTRGERISFAVTIIGKRDLVSVRADVTGALNFQFPAAVPADSTFTTILRVETGEARGDSLQVRVIATDEAGRTGEGRRLVRLQ